MSYLRLGAMQGRVRDDIVVSDWPDKDGELEITFEECGSGEWGSEVRYLSRSDMVRLRDHLNYLLDEDKLVDTTGVS